MSLQLLCQLLFIVFLHFDSDTHTAASSGRNIPHSKPWGRQPMPGIPGQEPMFTEILRDVETILKSRHARTLEEFKACKAQYGGDIESQGSCLSTLFGGYTSSQQPQPQLFNPVQANQALQNQATGLRDQAVGIQSFPSQIGSGPPMNLEVRPQPQNLGLQGMTLGYDGLSLGQGQPQSASAEYDIRCCYQGQNPSASHQYYPTQTQFGPDLSATYYPGQSDYLHQQESYPFGATYGTGSEYPYTQPQYGSSDTYNQYPQQQLQYPMQSVRGVRTGPMRTDLEHKFTEEERLYIPLSKKPFIL